MGSWMAGRSSNRSVHRGNHGNRCSSDTMESARATLNLHLGYARRLNVVAVGEGVRMDCTWRDGDFYAKALAGDFAIAIFFPMDPFFDDLLGTWPARCR